MLNLATPAVTILGGGPAGAATALALARAGVSVLVADADEGRGDKVGESLPPSVNALLARLGVWRRFLDTAPLPCHRNRSAWGGDGALLDHDFINDPHGHGWHIDRRRFDEILLDAAEDAGACVLRRSRLAGVARSDDGRWLVHLAGAGEEPLVASDLLIDATGRVAGLARRLGARRRRADRLVAAVAFLGTAGRPALEDSSTLVEATPDGWWYSAPLPDGRLVVALMTDADLASARDVRTRDGWCAHLWQSEHTRARVAEHGGRPTVAPRVVAAGSGRLDPVAGDGWLAVGDAAATHDPLSSHGIGAALDGGLRAAGAARSWLAGDRAALTAYDAAVRRAFARYQWMWPAYYAEERRWPDAPFWRRRQEGARRAGMGVGWPSPPTPLPWSRERGA